MTASNIDFEMLPFVMNELAAMVMQKKTLDLEDALYYIYSSELYQMLLEADTKAWYLSTTALYELLEKEKERERQKNCRDKKIMLFKMFCIENFRIIKNLPAKECLALFAEYDVFPFLEDTYEMLHTQDHKYIIDSIAVYIKNKKKGV